MVRDRLVPMQGLKEAIDRTGYYPEVVADGVMRAVSGEDEPRFVKQFVAWTVKHPRVRMLVYYDGFGTSAENPYDLSHYPRTTNTLRLKLRRPTLLQYAEYNAGTLQPIPPKSP